MKKVKDALELLKNDEWEMVRQKGSHRQFKHPIKKGLLTVAGKPSDDLGPKTWTSILKQAGLNQ